MGYFVQTFIYITLCTISLLKRKFENETGKGPLRFFLDHFVLFKAPSTNAFEGQIPRFTNLVIPALYARKISAANQATLCEAHVFVFEDFPKCVGEFFDVVEVADTKRAVNAVVLQPQPKQKHKLVLFQTGKPERLLT
jgi:hypothetical protein